MICLSRSYTVALLSASLLFVALASGARAAADPFKAAYARALGPLVKERWLISELNDGGPEPRWVTIAGTRYRQQSGCKPHDCGDNNVVVLSDAASGAVYGQVLLKARASQFGAPPPAVAAELPKLWKAEFRQGQ